MKVDLRIVVPVVFLSLALGHYLGVMSMSRATSSNAQVKEAFEAGTKYVAAKTKYCIVDSMKTLQEKMGDKVPSLTEAFTFLADNMEPCNKKIIDTGIEEKVVRETFPDWTWPAGVKD